MKLQAYIEQSGLTAAEFSRLIQASQSIVSRLISGQRKPSLRTMVAIEKVTRGKVKPKDFL
jgi:DNA-binding transcriptional regulator YdaS (Cro superfamily)